MSQPWRTAITQRRAVPSFSLLLCLCICWIRNIPWCSLASLFFHSHTHHTHDLLSYNAVCACMHACEVMCAHICVLCAWQRPHQTQWSSTLPHPSSSHRSDSNTENKGTIPKPEKKNKYYRLHLAQCLYLRFPSMCLGRRSGGTEPQSAWKQ